MRLRFVFVQDLDSLQLEYTRSIRVVNLKMNGPCDVVFLAIVYSFFGFFKIYVVLYDMN